MRIVVLSLLLAGLVLPVGAAHASDDLQSIIDQAQRIQERALSMPKLEELLRPGAPVPRFSGSPMSVPDSESADPPAFPISESGRRIEILVSWSLGEQALENLFRSVAGRSDVFIAFRGVADGETLGDAITRLHSILRHIEPVPNVQIDPTKFRRLNATSVPTMALVEDGQVIAQVRGIMAPDYLEDRVEEGASGDLGHLGPTAEILEPDLIEVMQARAEALDLEEYRRRAIEGYWSKARFQELPEATEPRIRRIDPTVVVTRPITDAKGNVLVEVGQRINPLEKVPFNQRLVVFDATKPAQVALAGKLAAEGISAGRNRVTLIATRLDRDASWDGLKAVQDQLDAPVYLLTHDLRWRFNLERVPATVEADGQAFIVTEYVPEKL